MGIPVVGRTIWSCNERDTSCDGVAGWTVSVCIANSRNSSESDRAHFHGTI